MKLLDQQMNFQYLDFLKLWIIQKLDFALSFVIYFFNVDIIFDTIANLCILK